MAGNKDNTVRMIGPKGKVSYVSRKASRSVHLANLGFMVDPNQDAIMERYAPPAIASEQRPASKSNTRADAGKA